MSGIKKHELQDEEIKVKVDAKGRILEIGKTVNIHEAIGESIGIEKFDKSLVKNYLRFLILKLKLRNRLIYFMKLLFRI